MAAFCYAVAVGVAGNLVFNYVQTHQAAPNIAALHHEAPAFAEKSPPAVPTTTPSVTPAAAMIAQPPLAPPGRAAKPAPVSAPAAPPLHDRSERVGARLSREGGALPPFGAPDHRQNGRQKPARISARVRRTGRRIRKERGAKLAVTLACLYRHYARNYRFSAQKCGGTKGLGRIGSRYFRPSATTGR